ncbi:unnamed protein product [Meloidogyne enterolobii]|uniref:Uncharacterized protein n=1 Tax=Meloidogyne enterolobii TaxID=390850 RepID=A0ACB0ZXC8_MELEN
MFLILILLFLIILSFWNFIWKRRNLPPGPTPLPIFGNAFAMDRLIYEQFQIWAKEFGPVYTIWMGEVPIVMVTDYELIRDLFVKEGDIYAGRHFLVDLFQEFRAAKNLKGGVTRMEGEQWKIIRRFGLQSMRNLGVGKNELENKLIKDLQNFIEKLKGELKTNITGEINLQKYIDRIVGSTINRLLFGYAFEDEQINEFYELKYIMDNELELLSSITGRMLLSMPGLRYLPVFSKTFKLLDDNIEKVFVYINRIVYERINKIKFGETEEPKDLLDYFLKQAEEAKNANWSEEKKENFDLKNLAPFSFDLFIAGQETTAKTLGFLVLYLLLDQRVQKKLHEELDNLREEKIKNGFDANFTMSDRTRLPYLNAVINETQRLANLLPINLAHRTMSDANILNKFNLKKGTPIVPQICCIFPRPYRFEPERFLDDQGMLKRVEQLIPFGIGKRICMGESLARMEIFLFASNFFSHFEVLPVDPLNPPSSEKRRGLTVAPIHYNCRLVARNINY